MSDPMQRSVDGSSGRWWPIGIVAFLALQGAFWITMLVVASSDPTFAVEPGYYEKAVHYDETAAQRAANVRLGWSVQVGVTPVDSDGRRRVVCEVVDDDGAPVAGAAVTCVAFSHLRAAQRIEFAFKPAADGLYVATAPIRRAGLWEFRVTVTRGDDIYTQRVQQTLDAPPN